MVPRSLHDQIENLRIKTKPLEHWHIKKTSAYIQIMEILEAITKDYTKVISMDLFFLNINAYKYASNLQLGATFVFLSTIKWLLGGQSRSLLFSF